VHERISGPDCAQHSPSRSVDALGPSDRASCRPPDAPPQPPSRGPGIRGGAIAGVAAGLLAGVCLVVSSALNGQAVWIPPKLASAPFFGERSLHPDFDALPLLVGLATHFAVCAAWGALFGAIFYGATRGATVALGALWGLVVWLAMHYGVLPLLGVANLLAIVPVGVSLIGHVLFGITLGVAFLPFQRVRRPFDWTF
jgi:hypothetical protein